MMERFPLWNNESARVGIVAIDRDTLVNPASEDVARALYRDMIVLEARACFLSDTLNVVAKHPQFAAVLPGQVIRHYTAEITETEAGEFHVTWR